MNSPKFCNTDIATTMKQNIATLLMLASFALLYTVAVEAQPIPLDALTSHYGRTVFELRLQGICNLRCQEISPIHCQQDVPAYTIFSPSSGKQLCDRYIIIIIMIHSESIIIMPDSIIIIIGGNMQKCATAIARLKGHAKLH